MTQKFLTSMCASSLWWISAVLIRTAVGEEAAKITDLVPAELKNWTIEYTAIGNGGAKQVVILKQDGNYRFQWGNRPEKVGNLNGDEATIFNETRDLFNRYQVRKLKGDTADLGLKITIHVKSGCGISVNLDPAHISQLGIGTQLGEVFDVFKRHGFSWFDSFDRYVRLGRPIGKLPIDRYPDREIPISFRLCEMKQAEPIENAYLALLGTDLELGDDVIRLRVVSDYTAEVDGKMFKLRKVSSDIKIAATRADATNLYVLTSRILNRYQLRVSTPNGDGSPPMLFHISCGLTFTCDRQTLIDVGVLDELDAWVKDINRRFEELGHKERFNPPWAE